VTDDEQANPVPIDEPPTRLELVLRYRWFALLSIVVLLGIAYAVAEGYAVPRTVKVFGLAFAAGSLLGVPAAGRLVDWLYSPPYTYLVDLDPVGSDFAIWELPPAVWRDLEVEGGGELYDLRAAAPAYEVQTYDPEENRAKGTWRGTATDTELIKNRTKIAEVRGELEEQARRGFAYEVARAGIVRRGVSRILRAFVQDFEAEGVYNGEAVQKAAERFFKSLDLDLEDEGVTGGLGDDGTFAEENLSGIEFVFGEDRDDQEASDVAS